MQLTNGCSTADAAPLVARARWDGAALSRRARCAAAAAAGAAVAAGPNSGLTPGATGSSPNQGGVAVAVTPAEASDESSGAALGMTPG